MAEGVVQTTAGDYKAFIPSADGVKVVGYYSTIDEAKQAIVAYKKKYKVKG